MPRGKRGDLDLADVVKVTRDPRWGLTRSERSLRDILAEAASLVRVA
jgi:hypothetical protein